VELPTPTTAPIEVGSGSHSFTCEVRPPEDDPVAAEPVNIHVGGAACGDAAHP
jgi:hypothetical protein